MASKLPPLNAPGSNERLPARSQVFEGSPVGEGQRQSSDRRHHEVRERAARRRHDRLVRREGGRHRRGRKSVWHDRERQGVERSLHAAERQGRQRECRSRRSSRARQRGLLRQGMDDRDRALRSEGSRIASRRRRVHGAHQSLRLIVLGIGGAPTTRAASNRANNSPERLEQMMGLSWQEGPLGRSPIGRFLTSSPMPERLLFAEPLRRRMSVELGGSVVARSDDAVLLFEPGRYPVAYFPLGDIAGGVLQASDHQTKHPDLGETQWFDVVGGHGHIARRGAWQHVDPPPQGAAFRNWVAFAWRAMDASYEEDERILGHAADPYHRIDIRQTSRNLVVRQGDRIVADTKRPLVLYESGFAPRWYVPRDDIDESALTPVKLQTFCPYKGLCSYYTIGDARQAAWSYPEAYPEVRRISNLVSFEPDIVSVHLDGTQLHLEPGQTVVPHGPDRNLDLAEVDRAASG